MVGDERQVIADEDLRAEGDADRERAVVAVAQPHGVRVVAVRRLQRKDAKVAHAVFGDAVVFFDHVVPVEAQRIPHHLDDAEMRNGHVRFGRQRRFQAA
jgi:hypothetical protein